ncbi:MAG: hypothetical protein K2H49_08245 [Muribaculaceae bacterium]|nr:hypothetical protein [Muribaculaceae bacterium]
MVLALVIIAISGGCTDHRIDPRLTEADVKMEDHPDSSMMILDRYQISPETSDLDRAMYGLLLTHARYKNFIDETDDSLISCSADYFLDHDDKELASRALFLQGIIRMNANHLGEAAVSFSKGLDIAHENKSYMWEGQCAFGLYLVYGEVHDGSAQVHYITEAQEAFCKGEYKDWMTYSQLELARAYNNNLQYDKSISILEDLNNEIGDGPDTLLLSELFQLKGLSLFALGRFPESMESYNRALSFDRSILTESDKRNIEICLHELLKDSVYSDINLSFNKVKIPATDSLNTFAILACNGKYKEAYEQLEHYKNNQDSVLAIIFRNNIAESVNQYKCIKDVLTKKKIVHERLTYWIVFLIFFIVCMLIIWRYRERMHKEKSMRLEIEANIESLRSDLFIQLERARDTSKYQICEAKQECNKDFEKIIKQNYAEANRLCDDYYQRRFIKNENTRIHKEIISTVKCFTDQSSLEKIIEYVDENSDHLYSSFKKDFFSLTEENYHLFLYLMLGFSPRTISVIFGQNIDAIYNKKSRLKNKITNSDISEKNKYLKYF